MACITMCFRRYKQLCQCSSYPHHSDTCAWRFDEIRRNHDDDKALNTNRCVHQRDVVTTQNTAAAAAAGVSR